MWDFSALSMTEIIRLQKVLQQELTRRFERHVALAFSDIVDSTAYFERFGDAAGRELQQLHLDLVNDRLRAHEGRLVDTAGDGAFLVFPAADNALDTLIEVQKAASRENASRAREQQMQLRIGAHWGSVLTDGAAVSGDAVNLCARVAGSCAAGEIRLTREMVQELAPRHRVNCRPLGPVELKGIARRAELAILDWRDRSVFPTRLRVMETREEIELPQQDLITFGRLREHEGRLANDIVLSHPDLFRAQQISRWHFELRRHEDGFRVRPVSDAVTEIDGVPIAKGREVAVAPGSKVGVAKVLTLLFLLPPEPASSLEGNTTRIVDESGDGKAP
jgi:class 3 adenylate cyclase